MGPKGALERQCSAQPVSISCQEGAQGIGVLGAQEEGSFSGDEETGPCASHTAFSGVWTGRQGWSHCIPQHPSPSPPMASPRAALCPPGVGPGLALDVGLYFYFFKNDWFLEREEGRETSV